MELPDDLIDWLAGGRTPEMVRIHNDAAVALAREVKEWRRKAAEENEKVIKASQDEFVVVVRQITYQYHASHHQTAQEVAEQDAKGWYVQDYRRFGPYKQAHGHILSWSNFPLEAIK